MKKWILIFLFLSACNSTHTELKDQPPLPGDNVGTGDENCTPQNMPLVVFEDVKAEIFDPSCVQCHGSAGGVNVENYANVTSQLQRIKGAIDSGRMPLGGSLNEDQKNLLAAWMNIGAPETSEDVVFCNN